MIYDFIDKKGTFSIKDPKKYGFYFPLTDKDGKLLSSISPNLSGDIKADNSRFLTPPASIEDLRTNLLCRRDFFIRTKEQTIRLSKARNDKLEAGFLYHKITKKINSLDIKILNFIPYNLPVEIMQVEITNKSARPVKFIPTSFIPLYGRSAENIRDHRHVSSLLNRLYLNKYGIFLKPTMIFDEKGHKENRTSYFCLGFEGSSIPPIGQFPTLDYFCGSHDLISPEAIEKDKPPSKVKRSEFDGKEALASFRFKTKTLKKNQTASYFLIMGLDSSGAKDPIKKVMRNFSKINSPWKIEKYFTATKKYWLRYLNQTDFDFSDKNFNNWLMWVKLQPTLRKLFGCSFLPHFDYGKGGRGWRDLWQDALTLTFTEPDKAKRLILDSFAGVRIDGSNATIITKDNKLISDRNQISRVWADHGIWPYLTLKSYINKTSDLNILTRDITYFKDHLLKRAKQIDTDFNQTDYLLRTKAGQIYKGSVLEHILIQHLSSFFNVGKHNTLRLENADWNDGLDMAAKEGESVAFSFMYAHNLGNLCFFLKNLKTDTVFLAEELLLLLDKIHNPINYNNFKDKQKRLDYFLEKTKRISGKKRKVKIENLIFDLEQKSSHLSDWLRKKEWLKIGFFNGYYDNKSKKAEGKLNNKIKMMLASQVFAIMSGIATKDQIRKIWASSKKYLQDKNLEGFRLNTDFGKLYLDLGRAFGFSYGDKENGAVFSHMVVMFSYSLFQQGFIKEAHQVIGSIYKMATSNKAKIPPLIPEYFNSQGKGLYLYLTGSASWYMYNLIEQILGIRFILGDIVLEPKLTGTCFSKKNITIDWSLKNKRLKISYIRKTKSDKALKISSLFINGVRLKSSHDKYIIERKKLIHTNNKELNIKVYLS